MGNSNASKEEKRTNQQVLDDDDTATDTSFVVSLRTNKDKHICGGVLINNQHVLTAAHFCVANKEVKSIVFGTRFLNNGGIRREVLKTYVHPSYMEEIEKLKNEGKNMKNETVLHPHDIAILLIRPVPKRTFPVITKPEMLNEDTKLQVMGWGETPDNPGISSKETKKMWSIYLPDSKCKQLVGKYNVRNCECTVLPYDGPCKGESVGPLMNGNNLVGIVSFRSKRGTENGYEAYTWVFDYIEWIKSVVESGTSC